MWILKRLFLMMRMIILAEVEAALRRHGWVQVRAAKELGLSQR